jgi:hypothetical protein
MRAGRVPLLFACAGSGTASDTTPLVQKNLAGHFQVAEKRRATKVKNEKLALSAHRRKRSIPNGFVYAKGRVFRRRLAQARSPHNNARRRVHARGFEPGAGHMRCELGTHNLDFWKFRHTRTTSFEESRTLKTTAASRKACARPRKIPISTCLAFRNQASSDFFHPRATTRAASRVRRISAHTSSANGLL